MIFNYWIDLLLLLERVIESVSMISLILDVNRSLLTHTRECMCINYCDVYKSNDNLLDILQDHL